VARDTRRRPAQMQSLPTQVPLPRLKSSLVAHSGSHPSSVIALFLYVTLKSLVDHQARLALIQALETERGLRFVLFERGSVRAHAPIKGHM
jgi:hypothetical protein